MMNHRDRHGYLQHALDELVVDYMRHHAGGEDDVLQLSVGALLAWAQQEASEPTEPAPSETHRDGVLLYAWVDDASRTPLPIATVPLASPVIGELLSLVLLVAAERSAIEQPVILEPLTRLAAAGVRLRLVRCVEVATLRELPARLDLN